MDNRNKYNNTNEHLGVNKIGKNIRKSPLHQPNFPPNPTRPQSQPQVYNINKNDFRSIVQQLTGSPSHEQNPSPPPPRPPNNSNLRPPSMRLQRIRPPPLTPPTMNRPMLPIRHPPPPHVLAHPPPANVPMPYNNNFLRQQPPLQMLPPPPSPGEPFWGNTNESPVSAYMHYLQNSIVEPGPRQIHPQFQQQQQQHQQPIQPQFHQQNQFQPPQPQFGILPHPSSSMPPIPSPRMMNGPPPLLPSPTSQFLLPSPSGFFNLLSPRSPYPLLSPGGYQFPSPLTPNFPFSPLPQSGILGPGPPPIHHHQHQPPLSPGIAFPISPSGFFPISSPRWRDF